MLEAQRDEIIGKHQTFLHPPEMSDQFADQFKRKVKAQGRTDSSEAIVLSKSGKRIPFDIKRSVTRIDDKEVVQGVSICSCPPKEGTVVPAQNEAFETFTVADNSGPLRMIAGPCADVCRSLQLRGFWKQIRFDER